MARTTTWRGFLKLALVSCPVRLHSGTMRGAKAGLHPVNRATLNRVQLRPHDPQTGKEITKEALGKGYEVEPGRFILVEDRELAELQIASSRTIELESFIERGAIDGLYLEAPYFLVPDGARAQDAYRVLHEALRRRGRIGLGRIVLGGRERAAAVEPRGAGMVLVTLRAAHEVRNPEPYFHDISAAPPDEAQVALAEQLIDARSGPFDPKGAFRDRYQEALFQLVQAKLRGEKPSPERVPEPEAVVDLLAALERSVEADLRPKPPAASRRRSEARAALRDRSSG